MAEEFSLIGVDALVARLKTLTDDVKHKGGRFALRKAANVVRDAAKQNAKTVNDPQTAASISDNIAVRWSGRTFKRTGNLMFRVGVMGGSGGGQKGSRDNLPGGDTRHWRMLEFGTEKMRAQPFMRKSLEQNINRATDEFIKQYDKALDRALARAKKAAK